jgi:hypothetical protein
MSNKWFRLMIALCIPLAMILFVQPAVSRAQGEDPTATLVDTDTPTVTQAYTPTSTDLPTDTPTPEE